MPDSLNVLASPNKHGQESDKMVKGATSSSIIICKEILVTFGERRRPVAYSYGDPKN